MKKGSSSCQNNQHSQCLQYNLLLAANLAIKIDKIMSVNKRYLSLIDKYFARIKNSDNVIRTNKDSSESEIENVLFNDSIRRNFKSILSFVKKDLENYQTNNEIELKKNKIKEDRFKYYMANEIIYDVLTTALDASKISSFKSKKQEIAAIKNSLRQKKLTFNQIFQEIYMMQDTLNHTVSIKRNANKQIYRFIKTIMDFPSELMSLIKEWDSQLTNIAAYWGDVPLPKYDEVQDHYEPIIFSSKKSKSKIKELTKDTPIPTAPTTPRKLQSFYGHSIPDLSSKDLGSSFLNSPPELVVSSETDSTPLSVSTDSMEKDIGNTISSLTMVYTDSNLDAVKTESTIKPKSYRARAKSLTVVAVPNKFDDYKNSITPI